MEITDEAITTLQRTKFLSLHSSGILPHHKSWSTVKIPITRFGVSCSLESFRKT